MNRMLEEQCNVRKKKKKKKNMGLETLMGLGQGVYYSLLRCVGFVCLLRR